MTRRAMWFEAINRNGKVITGELAADSIEDALDQLASRNLFVRHIQLQNDRQPRDDRSATSWNLPFTGVYRFGTRQLAILLRELATLSAAGLTIADCLELSAENATTTRARSALTAQIDKVRSGVQLSLALLPHLQSKHAAIGGLIAAGEENGDLPAAINSAAAMIEAQLSFSSRLQSALVYPAFLVVSSLVAFAIVFLTLIPTLAPLFDGREDMMPTALQWLLALQSIIADTGDRLLLLAVALLAVTAALIITRSGQLWLMRVVYRLPIYGPICRQRDVALAVDTLAVLLQHRVEMRKSLSATRSVASEPGLRQTLADAIERINEGEALSSALERADTLPSLVIRAVRSGEASGQIPKMLRNIGLVLNQQLERRIERTVSSVGPLLTLFIGGLIGFIVIVVVESLAAINSLAGL
ncbi:MAG: type II secretion system F family protein [Pseudomonadota bacterium]